ncbi:5'-3' exoribonuclease 3-like [Andrographis paniculata]|uniref:5'-3' exoribonuclease 3-like n=1 Tax=Andrographis paniculata TaxID=175694 RepID=UPI0021E999A0|nr:5'-3' exoribonuclease 3-like [Andrographis paniculata]
MGVPSFYRWLVNKYPKVVSDAEEDRRSSDNGGLEFDNLYLDMNGIIHPCFHPEDDVFPPTSFEEVFRRVFDYVDRLFAIVKPRKLLVMAIDGVAPRAKMNQQRARRFHTSKDNQMAEEIEQKLRQEFEKQGKMLSLKKQSDVSDSNIITPGTEFMHMLSKKLQEYIKSRIFGGDRAWANIKVILSDDNVPGEGEHKIMSFIRAQRSSPGYDPNTRHCLYGLDADLIMLGLATHELHFSILREEVLSADYQHHRALASVNPPQESDKIACIKKQPYQFINLWVLREYLALEFCEICGDNIANVDRMIDDFIFMCFLVGNDFLPHLPSLEIREGCIDLMMKVYKDNFESFGGYLVDMQRVDDKKGGYIKLKRVERFILLIGEYEEKIFNRRLESRDRLLKRIISEYSDSKEEESIALDEGWSSDIVCAITDPIALAASVITDDDEIKNMKELKQAIQDIRKKQSDLFKDGFIGTDKVKFGKEGWKERYYRVKFSAQDSAEAETIRKSVVAKFGEGLCWSLLYYFSGVPSWTWFYPYHYSPLPSDFKGLSQTKVKFEKGLPFKPFDQLMGVLPPSSSHALPVAYKGLMTDPNSSIIDFYPTDFETDLDGKRFTWQGVSKLPFIDETRLLAETSKLEKELEDKEKLRNSESINKLFLRKCSLGNSGRTPSEKIKDAIKMECTIEGLKGFVHVMPHDLLKADDECSGWDVMCSFMPHNLVKADDEYSGRDVMCSYMPHDLIKADDEYSGRDIMCLYHEVREESQHIPRLLEGVTIPGQTVRPEDIEETTLWHERVHPQIPTRQNSNVKARLPPLGNFKAPGGGRGRAGFDRANHVPGPGIGHQQRFAPNWGSGHGSVRRNLNFDHLSISGGNRYVPAGAAAAAMPDSFSGFRGNNWNGAAANNFRQSGGRGRGRGRGGVPTPNKQWRPRNQF